jgi:hypothetical protein
MGSGDAFAGELEAQYERLFASVSAEGPITAESRAWLDRAAHGLGLDRASVDRIETVWRKERGVARGSGIRFVTSPGTNAPLHDQFEAARQRGDLDAEYRIACVLARRGGASEAQAELASGLRPAGPPSPTRGLTPDGWHLLAHPGEDRATSEVFACAAPAALRARLASLSARGALPHLDPAQLQGPFTSTVPGVRAVAWAAFTLGVATPPIYLSPELDAGLEILVAAPPVTRVGARALSGPTPLELAFRAGRHLAWYRPAQVLCALVPDMRFLQELFLAALSVVEPGIRIAPERRLGAEALAHALRSELAPEDLARLRLAATQFRASGGRTHLRSWVLAADSTACRAGLLLSGDLDLACELVAGEVRGADRVRELEDFWASDAAGELRQALGIAFEPARIGRRAG